MNRIRAGLSQLISFARRVPSNLTRKSAPKEPAHQRAAALEKEASIDGPLSQRLGAVQDAVARLNMEYMGDPQILPARLATDMARESTSAAAQEQILRLGLKQCTSVTAASACMLGSLALKMLDQEVDAAHQSLMAVAAVDRLAAGPERPECLALAPGVHQVKSSPSRLEASRLLLRAAAGRADDSSIVGVADGLTNIARSDDGISAMVPIMRAQLQLAGQKDAARTFALAETALTDGTIGNDDLKRSAALAVLASAPHDMAARMGRVRQALVDMATQVDAAMLMKARAAYDRPYSRHSYHGYHGNYNPPPPPTAAASSIAQNFLGQLKKEVEGSTASQFEMISEAAKASPRPEKVIVTGLTDISSGMEFNKSGPSVARFARLLWNHADFNEVCPSSILISAARETSDTAYAAVFRMLARQVNDDAPRECRGAAGRAMVSEALDGLANHTGDVDPMLVAATRVLGAIASPEMESSRLVAEHLLCGIDETATVAATRSIAQVARRQLVQQGFDAARTHLSQQAGA